MAKKTINEQQKKFAREYLVDLNATQAAIRAGYSGKNPSESGYQLIQNYTVWSYIEKLIAKRAKRLGLSQDFVLRKLLEVLARCLQGTPVFDREGEATVEWVFNAAGANKALELIGRHLGMFKDRDINLNLSFSDLAKLVEGHGNEGTSGEDPGEVEG